MKRFPRTGPRQACPSYDCQIKGEHSLVSPPQTLAGLQEISGAALVAMAMAGAFAVLDGLAGPAATLTGLLAVPPIVAAMSASRPETGLVAGLCGLLAVLSGLWNMNMAEGSYVAALLVVAAGAAAGLWAAGLRASLVREQRAAELMADAGVMLEEDLDLTRRAEHLASLAVPELGDVAAVDLLGPRNSILRAACVSTTPGVAEELVNEQEAETKLVLPLRARGETLGTLSLLITNPSNRFDHIAQRTAQRLADRGALALDNARLHERQSHIASVLQDSLRPRSLPRIAGFDASSRFLAAGAAYEVGGDFYDVFHTGSGVWTIVIGDVCGKGPEAAALTALARHTVRSASEPDVPPSEVLSTLHDSISVEQTGLRFCTAALAQLSAPSNGRGEAPFTVSLGGHPPPMVVRRDGQIERVGDPGTLLGAIANPTLHDHSSQLAVGDALVLYTDGMLEKRLHDDGEDPERWLEGCLGEVADGSADEIAEALASAALKRQGGVQRDDIAILVLRRTGKP